MVNGPEVSMQKDLLNLNGEALMNNIITGVTGHSDRANGHVTDTGWKTVESQQEIKEKRRRSRMSAGKTENGRVT